MRNIDRDLVLGAALAILLAGFTGVALSQEEELPPPDTAKFIPPEIKVDKASKARISFLADTFDFGSIPRGSTVVHRFIIKNTGQDVLEISDVRPTCGCTTAPLSSNKIQPGEEATLKASFNSQKFNGRVRKEIYVNSNDPINPYLKISFTATINDPLLPITLVPGEADFGAVKTGTSGQLKLKMNNGDTAPHEVSVVEESAPGVVKADLSTIALGPNGNSDLTLELSPQAKAGELKESITFNIKGGQDARFTIPWKAVITQ